MAPLSSFVVDTTTNTAQEGQPHPPSSSFSKSSPLRMTSSAKKLQRQSTTRAAKATTISQIENEFENGQYSHTTTTTATTTIPMMILSLSNKTNNDTTTTTSSSSSSRTVVMDLNSLHHLYRRTSDVILDKSSSLEERKGILSCLFTESNKVVQQSRVQEELFSSDTMAPQSMQSSSSEQFSANSDSDSQTTSIYLLMEEDTLNEDEMIAYEEVEEFHGTFPVVYDYKYDDSYGTTKNHHCISLVV